MLAADSGEVTWQRRAADPRAAPALRLHARGARPLPEDDRHRPARLPRPAARDERATPPAAAPPPCWSGWAWASGPASRWRSSRWATSSACRSPPRWCTTPRCWCWTSRSPGSTRWPSTSVVGVLRERAAAGRAGAVLQPPARRGRAALRRPGDHRRRRDPGRRAAAPSCAPATRCRASPSRSTPTPAGCATSPGVTLVDLDGAARRLRPGPRRRRPGRCCAPPWPAARSASFAPGHAVARRDLPGGAPVTTVAAARLVAAREIRVKLRDKTFLFSTVFFLLIAVAQHGAAGAAGRRPDHGRGGRRRHGRRGSAAGRPRGAHGRRRRRGRAARPRRRRGRRRGRRPDACSPWRKRRTTWSTRSARRRPSARCSTRTRVDPFLAFIVPFALRVRLLHHLVHVRAADRAERHRGEADPDRRDPGRQRARCGPCWPARWRR